MQFYFLRHLANFQQDGSADLVRDKDFIMTWGTINQR
jgi:hypothetical protein